MLIKGLFTDVVINNQPPDFARFLKNVLLTEQLGTPINEPGFTVCVPGSDLPYEVIGVHVINEAIVLWSTDNTNSEIGIVENCTYKTIVNDDTFSDGSLNFNLNAPIDAEHYFNFLSERIVSWIDDVNDIRIINIDNPNVGEINDIRTFPYADTPVAKYAVRDSGGAIPVSSIQFVYSYANFDGLRTSWFSLSQPIPIVDEPLAGDEQLYDGEVPGVATSKSVEINFSFVDTRFDIVKLAVVKTENQLVTVDFVRDIIIADEAFTAIYTGTEGSAEDITLEEILIPLASYTNAKAIGQVNNKLFLANLEVEEEVDLQTVALDTKIEWSAEYNESFVENLNDNGSSKFPTQYNGFWPGEVYAFYLVGEKLNGSKTAAFHIPGRVANTDGEKIKISNAGALGSLNGTPFEWEVNSSIETAVITTGSKVVGQMGYWENKDEDYDDEPIYENIEVILPAQNTEGGTDFIRTSSGGVKSQYRWLRMLKGGVGSKDPLYPKTPEEALAVWPIGTVLNMEIIAADSTTWLPFENLIVADIKENTQGSLPENYLAILVSPQEVFTGGGKVLVGDPFDPKIITNPPPPVPNDTYATIQDLFDGMWEGGTIKPIGTLVQFVGNTYEVSDIAGDSSIQDIVKTTGGYYEVISTTSNSLVSPTLDNYKFVFSMLPLFGVGRSFAHTYRINNTITITDKIQINLGGPVRHHRFPTLNQLSEFAALGRQNSIGATLFPKLSVKVTNVNLTAKHKEKIKRWHIVFAKRSPVNATVMGQANYQFAGAHPNIYSGSNPIVDYYSSIANIQIGATAAAPVVSHLNKLKFNCFDLLVGQPTLLDTYIRNEVKLVNANGYFNHLASPATGVANQANGHYREDSSKRWLFNNHFTLYTSTPVEDKYKLREITEFIYQPANVVGNGYDLQNGEFSLYLTVRSGGPESVPFTPSIPGGGGGQTSNSGLKVSYIAEGSPTSDTTDETYLSTLCQKQDNMYLPYTSQDLVLTHGEIDVNLTEGLFDGGDCKAVAYALKQSARLSVGTDTVIPNDPANVGQGTMGITYFGSYSTRNAGLRYSSIGDISTLYFPKVKDFYDDIFDVTHIHDYRKILYAEDFNSLNDKNTIIPFNSRLQSSSKLPHTIIHSLTKGLEEQNISWQTFLPADRYVMPREKGEIINLQGVGNDRLFIHQEHSLFLTRSTTTLKGGIADVTLGSGELFSVTPAEVLSTDEGFGGTQHKFSCKLTKAGYAFMDAAQGKIFLHNGSSLDEISKMGQRIFFRDAINKDLIDNPFIALGATIYFDEKYNRLLFSYREGGKSFTSSYSPATKAWISYHDYFPDYLIETRKANYSLKNINGNLNQKGIYLHNDTINGNPGVYYNVVDTNPIPFPILIDIVYNAAPDENKIFGAVEWASEVIQAGGIQIKDETIDYITLSNNNKTTGRVELENLVNLSQIHGSNVRNVNEFWSFNGIRDISISGLPFRLDFYNNFAMLPSSLDFNRAWYRKAKFNDRFMLARFEYLNTSGNNFTFLYHKADYRKSYR